MSDSTLATEYVADTIALVLRIERRKMGPAAKKAFEAVESGQVGLHLPGMVLAEILYLAERRRISASLQEVEEYLRRHPTCKEAPLGLAVIRSAVEISDIPELHDQLIAATARQLHCVLVTNDPVIQASAFVKTVW